MPHQQIGLAGKRQKILETLFDVRQEDAPQNVLAAGSRMKGPAHLIHVVNQSRHVRPYGKEAQILPHHLLAINFRSRDGDGVAAVAQSAAHRNVRVQIAQRSKSGENEMSAQTIEYGAGAETGQFGRFAILNLKSRHSASFFKEKYPKHARQSWY